MSGDTQADPAPPHLRETNGAIPAIGFIGEAVFTRANLVDGSSEVAIPFQCIHRQIQVRIENQHAQTLKLALALGKTLTVRQKDQARAPAIANTEMIVSMIVHVCSVCGTLSPKYSFTNQKPTWVGAPSDTCAASSTWRGFRTSNDLRKSSGLTPTKCYESIRFQCVASE